MRRNNVVFEGLVEIESRIRRLSSEVGYLTVSDRSDRSHEEQLGRFDFTMKDALPYLEAVDEPRGAEDAEEYEDWREEEDEEEDESEEQEREAASEELATIAEAGCRWLRDIAYRNTVGEPFRRFRVKAYSHKGLRLVDTASFVCKNVDHDLDLPVAVASSNAPLEPELRIPTPSFEDGTSRGFKALGDFYAQWGQIVLGSVGQLQGINNAMMGRLHRQLQESRGQVDQLVASILEFRVAEIKAADERRSDDRADDNRTELAKHALVQLGEMAKALLAARGLPAELGDTLGAIGQNPSLVSALNEPDVKALLAEPQNLELIAGMLRQAGQQARMLREATQNHTS